MIIATTVFSSLLLEHAKAIPKDALVRTFGGWTESPLAGARILVVESKLGKWYLWVKDVAAAEAACEVAGVTAKQVMIAMTREHSLPTFTQRMVEAIVQADDRAITNQQPCPFCSERPHLSSCLVGELRAMQVEVG